MNYNYFIPIIHLGPLEGYTFNQVLPLLQIENVIIGNKAKFEIIRKVFCNKTLLHQENKIINFNQGNWTNKQSATFEWDYKKSKKKICYIETQINLLRGKGLKTSSLPAFYVNYTSKNKKSFMSCGNEKYGNPRVILQMKEFGMWVDGYPGVNINKQKKTSYSLVIINPYKAMNSLFIEINSLAIKKNIKVPAFSTKLINFYDIVNKGVWSGQFYIYGKRRAIIHLINHEFKNYNNITTLEHSDPFRAELTYFPKFQSLRNKIHKKLKGLLN